MPPQITPFDFGDEPMNSGEMASVICAVSKGDFPINITWTLNGRLINKFDGITILKTNKHISQLSIDSVQGINTGQYVCTAANNAGNMSHSAYLNVNGTLRFRIHVFCIFFLMYLFI